MVTTLVAVPLMLRICQVLHYLGPPLILIFYLSTRVISIVTLQNLNCERRYVSRMAIFPLMSCVPVTYMVEASMLLMDTFAQEALYSSTDSNIYPQSSFIVWLILTAQFDADTSVWYPYYGSWFICIGVEALLLSYGVFQGGFSNVFVSVRIAIRVCRMFVLVLLPVIYFSSQGKSIGEDDEHAPLLGQSKAAGQPQASPVNSAYATISWGSNAADNEVDEEPDGEYFVQTYHKKEAKIQERLRKENWFAYAKSFLIFAPFLWPSNERALQLNILGVFLCLLGRNALNLLEPRQFGIVLDKINTLLVGSKVKILVLQMLLYFLYRWLRSSVVGPLRRLLWLPVEQHALKSLKKAAYGKIMTMSRDFHTEKQSGELYRAVDQGTSIVDILEHALFRIGPVLVDLVVAIGYLTHLFGAYMALIIGATSAAYFALARYSSKLVNVEQRRCARLMRREAQVMYDSVGGWSTVSYFNRHGFERQRYGVSVDDSSTSLKAYNKMYSLFDSLEDIAVDLGLVCAILMATYQIIRGDQTVGTFVMLVSYWGNFTGNLYLLVGTQRQMLRNLIDAEALLEMFQKSPSVRDGSQTLQYKSGAVEFNSVYFSYDGKKSAIEDFSFRADPGQRVALVGETGGGKSTILKLLFRFYDVQGGSINIDGQNVKDLTLESLRECIGVVPQDPSMFNDTVMENVRYSRLDATNEEVIQACKVAAVHDKILTFTKGYRSRVGEGGLKLSGGELQRIAIARVVLMDPKIVLLDEATSSVDSETEAKIQEALERLTKGRTTFTVAHRLSTVQNSDLILVVKEGKVAEKGSPQDLLKARGKYYNLWLKQMGITTLPDSEEIEERDLSSNEYSSIITGAQEPRRSSGESSASGRQSLRPSAPAFVPRNAQIPNYQRSTIAKGGQPSHSHETSSHPHFHDHAHKKSHASGNNNSQKAVSIGTTDGSADARDPHVGSPQTEKVPSQEKSPLQQTKSLRHRRNQSDSSVVTLEATDSFT